MLYLQCKETVGYHQIGVAASQLVMGMCWGSLYLKKFTQHLRIYELHVLQVSPSLLLPLFLRSRLNQCCCTEFSSELKKQSILMFEVRSISGIANSSEQAYNQAKRTCIKRDMAGKCLGGQIKKFRSN